ncbi:putative receptor-like protein kinase At3g47110 [Solanum pennellii]|uniref:Receptor-like protein kinase At3g47110 n=1 Tax=Solanum pennellii TaxID=28526 RepID=A0ABM1FIN0_SOLPN|nr:putative receptor-like protein kinase At3g47110 [Solanum pennellii]
MNEDIWNKMRVTSVVKKRKVKLRWFGQRCVDIIVRKYKTVGVRIDRGMKSFNLCLCVMFSYLLRVLSVDASFRLSENETNRLALLRIKTQITYDPSGVTNSWNDPFHHCSWQGVTCSARHLRLTMLDLSSKQVVGTLVPQIGNMSFLKELFLQNNTFNSKGVIPSSFSSLRGMEYLDLSRNKFSGLIPKYFETFISLKSLYLSFNNFEGEVPRVGVFSNASAAIVNENRNLCGGAQMLKLPQSLQSIKQMIRLETVTIKILDLQHKGALKSFIAECEVLKNLMHRNLVKLVTACSGTNFQGNDFKALIYEFMVNGSLDDWLHFHFLIMEVCTFDI